MRTIFDGILLIAWWLACALTVWAPIVMVPWDVLKNQMTFAEAVRFNFRVYLRTIRDGPRR